MSISARPVAVLLIAAGLAACERNKSYNPLSTTIAGPLPNVSMTPPEPIQPSNGKTVLDTEQPLVLVMNNALSNSPRPFTTEIQIAADEQFSSVVTTRTGIAPGEDGFTRLNLGDRLAPGRRYYWRALANDGANTSGWSRALNFDVVVPVVLGAPEPLTPIANARVSSVTPELRVRNGSASGPYSALFYEFQISPSPNFTTFIADAEVPQDHGGETRYTSPPLPSPDTPYFWRARQYDAKNLGPWSRVEAFVSPPMAPPPPPAPPGPPAGGPCNFSDPDAIVVCERNKYGHMSGGQILAFLNAVASSLNRNGIAEGPFGLLRKTSGNNCDGYSCDIICSGQGSAQKQWDVLHDLEGAQRATWSGPEMVPHIRVDICEIR